MRLISSALYQVNIYVLSEMTFSYCKNCSVSSIALQHMLAQTKEHLKYSCYYVIQQKELQFQSTGRTAELHCKLISQSSCVNQYLAIVKWKPTLSWKPIFGTLHLTAASSSWLQPRASLLNEHSVMDFSNPEHSTSFICTGPIPEKCTQRSRFSLNSTEGD